MTDKTKDWLDGLAKSAPAPSDKADAEFVDYYLQSILAPTERGHSLRQILYAIYRMGYDTRHEEGCG